MVDSSQKGGGGAIRLAVLLKEWRLHVRWKYMNTSPAGETRNNDCWSAVRKRRSRCSEILHCSEAPRSERGNWNDWFKMTFLISRPSFAYLADILFFFFNRYAPSVTSNIGWICDLTLYNATSLYRNLRDQNIYLSRGHVFVWYRGTTVLG